jgi:hypothetical protein
MCLNLLMLDSYFGSMISNFCKIILTNKSTQKIDFTFKSTLKHSLI